MRLYSQRVFTTILSVSVDMFISILSFLSLRNIHYRNTVIITVSSPVDGKTHLEVVTLNSQNDPMSFYFSFLSGDESHVMKEAILLFVDLPKVLHQLKGVLLRDDVVS